MPSTYTQNYYHTVFSTRQRTNQIKPALEERLYPFMGGIRHAAADQGSVLGVDS